MKVTNVVLAGAAVGLSTANPVNKRAISDGMFSKQYLCINVDRNI